MIGPMPGMVANSRLIGLALCIAMSFTSIALISAVEMVDFLAK